MQQFKKFCGGVFDTNCYLFAAPGGNVLFDAPQGSDEAFAGDQIDLLVLTHGHYDHVADGAAIIARQGCQAVFHRDTAAMTGDPGFFRSWGFGFEVEPFEATAFLGESASSSLLGLEAAVLEVPGHCPGSLCFHLKESDQLVGGDVLFRGGVGRCDLPGGDEALLYDGIRKKLMTLPDGVVVLPGHGPETTIGRERRMNPFRDRFV